MMSLGNLRAMALDARRRHDDAEVAEALDAIAAARSIEIRRELGGCGWERVQDIPDGKVFCAATRPRGVRWRREGELFRALPPSGTGRLYSAGAIESANAWDTAGYVEVTQ